MGNSKVKSHQATEVRLRNRRKREQPAQANSQQSHRGGLGNSRRRVPLVDDGYSAAGAAADQNDVLLYS